MDAEQPDQPVQLHGDGKRVATPVIAVHQVEQTVGHGERGIVLAAKMFRDGHDLSH